MTNATPQGRLEQLESVKQFISLKTYHAIQEKLHAEEVRTKTSHDSRDAKVARDSAPQALPRDAFEERRMPMKLIRID